MTDLPDRLEEAAQWSMYQWSPAPDWEALLEEAAAALRALEADLRHWRTNHDRGGGAMSDFGRLKGHCPMGCGETLFVASEGYITCSWHKCPNPTAVADLLEDRETEHTVDFDEDGFIIQHPLRERLDGELFRCNLHARLSKYDGPPIRLGRFRVAVRPNGLIWTEKPA